MTSRKPAAEDTSAEIEIAAETLKHSRRSVQMQDLDWVFDFIKRVEPERFDQALQAIAVLVPTERRHRRAAFYASGIVGLILFGFGIHGGYQTEVNETAMLTEFALGAMFFGFGIFGLSGTPTSARDLTGLLRSLIAAVAERVEADEATPRSDRSE